MQVKPKTSNPRYLGREKRYVQWGKKVNGRRSALTFMTSADLILLIPLQKLCLNV